MDRKSLERGFSELPRPKDYFHGRGFTEFPTPENILLFYRGGVLDPRILHADYNQHHRYVAIFNFAQAIQVILDEAIIRITEGEGLLILPYQYHRFINEGQKQLSLAFITFSMAETVYFENRRNVAFRWGGEVEGILDSIFQDYRNGAEENLPYRTALLLRRVFEGGEGDISGMYEHALSEPLILRIIRAVQGNYSAGIGEIADMLGYSERYLRGCFRQRMGLPLGRFILELRLARAKRLLMETRQGVSAVADACGYGSLYAFSRSFRQHCGLSPSAYRKAKHRDRGA